MPPPIVKYIGQRAYVEFKHNGIKYGFGRGHERDDIPTELAEQFSALGYEQWEVSGLSSNEELLAVIETDDSHKSDAPFNPEWTRQEMIKWFSAQGESTPRTATKASLTARAEALLNPTPVVEEETEADEDDGDGDE